MRSLCLLLLLATPSLAQDITPKPEAADRKAVMDHGPFLSATVVLNPKSKTPQVLAHKGIVIPLGDKKQASFLFDTETLTLSHAWLGHLDLSGTMLTNHKGTYLPSPIGEELFSNPGLGWSDPTKPNIDFGDPRPNARGSLPHSWGRFKGVHVNDGRVVLSYTIGDCDVLESASLKVDGEKARIIRHLRIGPSVRTLYMDLCGGKHGVAIDRPPRGASEHAHHNGRLILKIPPGSEAAVFTVEVTDSGRIVRYGDSAIVINLEGTSSRYVIPLPDPLALTKPGPSRFPPITLPAKPSPDSSPFVSDSIPLPASNPWNSWMRLTGLDFFPDGRAVVCTLNGDVWLISGLGGDLSQITWKRFATGLYEPLGLKIISHSCTLCSPHLPTSPPPHPHVLVRGRDQITRLHDLNNDSEADFYENFNNDGLVNPSYHGFAFELQADSKGNLYYTRTGHRADSGYPGHGCILRISPDGKKHEVFATGLRAPNGLAITPRDEVLVADNQGNWVPSSKIHLVKEGDFLGYLPQHHRAVAPTSYPNPLAWLPMKLDSSSGSPIPITSDKWGSYKGHLAHPSFGRSTLSLILTNPTDPLAYSTIIPLPLKFDSGIMRGQFHPIDGQLYLIGIGGGWQSGGPKDGGFYRVRRTDKPLEVPISVKVIQQAIQLTFDQPLDPAAAADPDNYALERWNYKWTEAYGSPDYSIANPTRKSRDSVEIKSAKLSADGKTLTLEIPDLQPAMQMSLQYNLQSATGAKLSHEIYLTINK